MAELAAAAIYEVGLYLGEYVATAEIGAALATYSTAIGYTLVAAAATYSVREQQRRQQGAAKDSYNASLRDRYVMFRGATEPRQVVLGRQRVSGPLAYVGSYGTNREHLVFAVILAAHECDGIEDIYFDDHLVNLDASGNVLGIQAREQFTITAASATFTISAQSAGVVLAKVEYGSTVVNLTTAVNGTQVTVSGATAGQTGTVTLSYFPAVSPYRSPTNRTSAYQTVVLDATGKATVTLAQTPDAGSVQVVANTGDYQMDSLTGYSTVAGTTVTINAPPFPNLTASVSYTYQAQQSGSAGISRGRIRKYLGGPGQVADAGMINALPGIWTTAHKMSGLCYLVVELDYDPDAFPSGLPNVSVTLRGAKLYDPRTGTTAWKANPALMMRYVATSRLLGNLPASLVDDTRIAAAANVCDLTASYVVNGQTYARPQYQAGLVVKSGTRAKDALDDLAIAMAGRWVFVDGTLRVKAGSYSTPLQTLDETWLSDSGGVQVQVGANRSDVVNVITGKFADERRDYQVLDYPRVAASAYITQDGAELPLDVPLNAVTFVGQAQQVAAARMRDDRQGLRVTLQCNFRAYAVEPFDVLNVTMPRFGWAAKPFEVLDVQMTLDGGIQLALKETDSSIWAIGTTFSATDPAPNTSLPSPWQVTNIAGLACVSGTAQLLRQDDGTIVSRMRVTWTPVTDAYVLDGGGVEVRIGVAGTPESQWRSILVPGGVNEALIADVQDGGYYLVKARAYNNLVKGDWCLAVLHKIIGKTQPPSGVVGFTDSIAGAGVLLKWTPCPDVDYDETELRLGSTWAGGTLLFRGRAASYLWLGPAVGSYVVLAKHFDSTGNESTTAASTVVEVDTAAQLQWSGIQGRPKLFRVVARGNNDTQGPAASGLFNGETGASLAGAGRSYALAVIDRATGSVVFTRVYDVYGVGEFGGYTAANLAADLNGVTTSQIVVLYTYDEPQAHRFDSGLSQAIYRCGGSPAVFGSPNFKNRSAYILVGIGGCGEGNGFEAYQGDVDNSTSAWCEVAFGLLSGVITGVSGSATPGGISDYGYTGDLNASADIKLVNSSTCTASGNSLSKTGGTGQWDPGVSTGTSYVGGAYAEATAMSTAYNLMFGLNTDPGATAAPNLDWQTLDFAWYLRADGNADVRESGATAAASWPYVAGDVFAVAYDNSRVLYLQNGVLRYARGASAGLRLYWDSSLYEPGASLKGIRFGPMTARNRVWRQESDPIANGAIEHDTWQIPSTGKEYQLFGGSWFPTVGQGSVGTPEIGVGAATDVFTLSLSQVQILGGYTASFNPLGSYGGMVTLGTLNFTASATCDVLITVMGPVSATGIKRVSDGASVAYPATDVVLQFGPTSSPTAVPSTACIVFNDVSMPLNSVLYSSIVISVRLPVTAGTTYAVVLRGRNQNATVVIEQLQMRAELIKR